jgi:hypothetical protein
MNGIGIYFGGMSVVYEFARKLENGIIPREENCLFSGRVRLEKFVLVPETIEDG